MKSKLIAIALFAATAATIAYYPARQGIGAAANPPPIQQDPQQLTAGRSQVEVVFVLDTTGSMGGLIQAAKEKIWSIASSMAQADPAPEIRMGLVAYRDRGDDYVTKVLDLSSDLDTMYAQLMDFQAQGGGDGPESVNQALNDAVQRISWSPDQGTYKVVFLVGDAPPHMDYQDDVKYPETLATAKVRGILVNTVQCGSSSDTRQVWQRVARLGGGDAFQVEQDGGAVAIATPFDAEMATLSAELDKTRLYYGSRAEKAEKRRKVAATEKLHTDSSVASQARRAAFNASKSGESNLLGGNELVEDVVSGRVDLSKIDKEALPAPMKPMAPEEQRALIEETAERRAELKKKIGELAGKRADYLRDKVEEAGGAEASLDHKIYRAVREQAAAKGLKYDAEAPKY